VAADGLEREVVDLGTRSGPSRQGYGCFVHEWNATGYDLLRADRWLYAFATEDHRLVKVGMVLVEERLQPRLAEVRRKSKRPDLSEVWRGCMSGTTHEEAEHIESVVRHWLTGNAGFSYVGQVDWLASPPAFDRADWEHVLDCALRESLRFGR
jgi:hypothetical protein